MHIWKLDHMQMVIGFELSFFLLSPDCQPASGRPDSYGDSISDVAGIGCPAPEGDAEDAAGQGQDGVPAERGL